MKNIFLKIISHYGYNNQLRKLNEECFELEEALILSEKESITEEVADVMVMLYQFIEFYGITNDEIKKIMKQKINRQLKRMEKENE